MTSKDKIKKYIFHAILVIFLQTCNVKVLNTVIGRNKKSISFFFHLFGHISRIQPKLQTNHYTHITGTSSRFTATLIGTVQSPGLSPPPIVSFSVSVSTKGTVASDSCS